MTCFHGVKVPSPYIGMMSCSGLLRSVQVHYGMVLPSGKKQDPPVGYLPWGGPIDEECATWLHLVNLFRGRDNRTTHELDTSWHWVFDKVSGYRMQHNSRHRLF